MGCRPLRGEAELVRQLDRVARVCVAAEVKQRRPRRGRRRSRRQVPPALARPCLVCPLVCCRILTPQRPRLSSTAEPDPTRPVSLPDPPERPRDPIALVSLAPEGPHSALGAPPERVRPALERREGRRGEGGGGAGVERVGAAGGEAAAVAAAGAEERGASVAWELVVVVVVIVEDRVDGRGVGEVVL